MTRCHEQEYEQQQRRLDSPNTVPMSSSPTTGYSVDIFGHCMTSISLIEA
jgi:hypothetical protein